ncbi:MAG: glycoside hydrolase [Kiritimatiellae bacterium]|nr:glycoside hydrolase [Kiritimatiellia bacterium]MDD5519660.1 glycoside hydrolase [Kiritimatiellia bacterium]
MQIKQYVLRFTFFCLISVWLCSTLPAQTVTGTQQLENKLLTVLLNEQTGLLTVKDKRAGITWVQFSNVKRPPVKSGDTTTVKSAVQNVSSISSPHPGLKFETQIYIRKDNLMPVTVTIMLPKDSADLRFVLDGVNDMEMSWAKYPQPFIPANGDETWLALSPYTEGLLLPMRTGDMPRMGWSSDMPFFCVVNLQAGWGYNCIFETPNDVRIELTAVSTNKPANIAAGIGWSPSMGKWSYSRKFIYHFSPSGGYVPLAKVYRAYAQEHGTLKTLREKMKRRPDIAKILGAPDIWGAHSVQFCREAKAAGIDHMLVNATWSVKDTEEVKNLGYLISVYDNYEDTMIGKKSAYGDFKLEDAPLLADGKRLRGWSAHKTDPKTGKTEIDPVTKKPVVSEQFEKRCTALFEQVARKWIPIDQKEHPRNARFLDVTTACGLVECYDTSHGCNRDKDIANRQALARYVSDELGLVLGGEHGRWWGVPYHDYWEGMQSGGFYSWPAGHVGMDLPKTRDEIGKDYLKYGIGHYYRIPLWELVFNDCVVSYWYWGDSTGHLYPAAPEISYKQDLFNMLNSDPPMYWVSQPYSFRWKDPVLRERLLESYRNTCKLHEQTGLDEMLTHEWLTEDRTVQKTTFSSGTMVVANFDEQKTYDLKDGDAKYTLAPLGFFAKGPTILQYRVVTDGRTVTCIKTPDYCFCDPSGKTHNFGAVMTSVPVTVRTVEPQKLNIILSSGNGQTSIRPAQLAAKWDMESSHLFLLDETGKRTRELPVTSKDGTTVELPQAGLMELTCGKKFDLPNPCITANGISINPESPKQGDKITITATISNSGRVKAKRVPVALYLGTQSKENLVGIEKVTVKPGSTEKADWTMDSATLDGSRKFIVVIDPEGKVDELLENDNIAEKTIPITADWSRWHYKLQVQVTNGQIEQENVPVSLAVDFGRELKRLGGTGMFDPNSIRVCECRDGGTPGTQLLSQFDKAQAFDPGKNPAGDVVWIIPGKLAPGAVRQFFLCFDVSENGPKGSQPGKMWDMNNQTANGDTYIVTFSNGCISGLSAKDKNGAIRQFMSGLVYSSKETGWVNEEDAKVLSMDVIGNGPVRAVVVARVKLHGDLTYEKTYSFYPERFDMSFKADKSYGVISRAYYIAEGTYEDNSGNKAKVDGKGDGEGVSGKCQNPKYYVVYAPGWAHSCISLSKFSNMTYWDSSNWGGIGFSGGDLGGARMSYVIHPDQTDSAFGKIDSDRLTNPPTVKLVE